MRKIYTLVFLFLVIPFLNSNSQSLGEWNGLTSYNSITELTIDSSDNLWAITNGGIIVTKDSTIIKKFTVIDGLSRLNASALHYNIFLNLVFVGYMDGRIDIINADTFEVTKLDDIHRTTSFSSKVITDFLSIDNTLLVSTSFGLVQYDLNNLVVTNTFNKFGSLSSAIRVNNIVLKNDTLYLATTDGIAYSAADNNYAPNEWDIYNDSNGFVSENITTIEVFNSNIYASTSNDNYIFDNNMWSINNDYGSNMIIDYKIQSDKLIAISEKFIYSKDVYDNVTNHFIPSTFATSLSHRQSDSELKFGTLNKGVGTFKIGNSSIQYFTPEGPFQNFVDDINFDNEVMIASSTQKSSGDNRIDKGKGFYIYSDNKWQNFNGYTNPILNQNGFRQAFTSLVTDNYYYFGSWGQGIARLKLSNNEIKVFNENNSTLRGWPANDINYQVISGLEKDSEGIVWAVSRFGGNPLYYQNPGDDDWIDFAPNSVVNRSDLYEGLFIDSFDQKWIPLQNAQASGTGLLVLDTGNKEDVSDDRGVKLEFGSNLGNLPDNKVNAIIQDKNNEVWIGTERGIAKFIFPELIIDGSAQERAAQWLINEDTSAVSRFLLRDVDVSAMAVNSANEKWIGSANQGIWVLNAEGSKIIKRFTTDNSPLFSNTINSIGIDDITGKVYIATDVGLITYQDVPQKPVSKMKELKVFPNPFNYDNHSEIIIEGLTDAASVKVLGVDGTVVDRFDTIGGRVAWDGYTANGNMLGSGVYFIVAVDDEGSSKGIGKVIIVR